MLGDAAIPSFEDIVNLYLTYSIFRRLWSKALAAPIPKTAHPVEASDLRPINILVCTASKVLEKAVYQQALHHLVPSNILNTFQSGFRPLHSTTTALINDYDDIKSNFDNNQLTFLVLFDFTQAFPSIVHEILFQKMSMYGFSPSVVDWFRAFLWQRTQSVRVGDRCSSWLPVDEGVAHGSPLASLCFSIYINDLPAVIQHSKYHLYADDLQIYKQFSPSTIFEAV